MQQAGRSEQQVSMTMNAEGAKAWARLTKENIGKAGSLSFSTIWFIQLLTCTVEITGGRSQITGHFTPEEAKDLANVLKSGKMAASVHIVQEDVVGPSLGQEAINSGVISFRFGFDPVDGSTCVPSTELLPGLIADGALVLNIFFTMGILASFQAVLTLPGIAGMVLTLGMAVDANVLIYERTKEELRAGKSLNKGNCRWLQQRIFCNLRLELDFHHHWCRIVLFRYGAYPWFCHDDDYRFVRVLPDGSLPDSYRLRSTVGKR